MPRRRLPLALLPLVALAAAAPTAQARTRPPVLTASRCVPATASACRAGVRVAIGRQVQLRGLRLAPGLRVTFRWSTGALATRLKRSRAGYVARVPPGTHAGAVRVTVRDRAGRRSNALRITVVAPAPTPQPAAASGATAADLPGAFAGDGSWIWELDDSDGGQLPRIVARLKAAGMTTVFVKGADGPSNRWAQFTPELVAAFHAQGIRVCGWQYVYGSDPAGEAAQGASVVAAGADCLVIDAESEYEGRYAAAQRYLTALRAAVGPSYPLGLTSFPYVDYHPGLPYSVFLGPGGAQVDLPQVYWKSIGGTVDAVSAHTFAHNRIYGAPIAPLGQTYGGVSAGEIARFRGLWAAYGSGGLSWWSYQATSDGSWAALDAPAASVVAPTDPGFPALGKGAKGDEVVWLQEHLRSRDASVPVDGVLGTTTADALKALQTAAGLPVTGTTDAGTWAAVLALPVTAVDWTARSRPTSRSLRTGAGAPRSASLPAVRDEIPAPGRGGRPR